jgi:hypothetical protein
MSQVYVKESIENYLFRRRREEKKLHKKEVRKNLVFMPKDIAELIVDYSKPIKKRKPLSAVARKNNASYRIVIDVKYYRDGTLHRSSVLLPDGEVEATFTEEGFTVRVRRFPYVGKCFNVIVFVSKMFV